MEKNQEENNEENYVENGMKKTENDNKYSKDEISNDENSKNEKNENKNEDTNIGNSNYYTSEIFEEENKNEQQDSKNQSKNYNIFSKIDDIQKELQETTKKIEQEKINLRICKERYEKKLKLYRELQGKPTQLTKEEKEKEKKKKKDRGFFSPISHKPGKNIEILENEIKSKKSLNKNTITFQGLTNEINILELTNQDLKNQIFNMKKQKMLSLNLREHLKEENKNLEKKIEQMKINNEDLKSKIKNNELKEIIDDGLEQQKNFIKTRDELENEYHRIIEEYIKREAERKKEHTKKQQLLLFGSDSKNLIKGKNSKEIERQLKLLSAEEISDRIPILEELINKWKYINKFKKHMIEKYIINSQKIKEAFDRILQYYDSDNYSELPIIFEKNYEQFSNIDKFLAQLGNNITEKENEKINLENKINNLTKNRIKNYELRDNYIKEKKEKIEELNNRIDNLEQEINNKRDMFLQIQPICDNFLLKLDSKNLSQFIFDKAQIDPNKKYNEKNIGKFISNVEDYYKLILMFDEDKSFNNENEENEIDKLRNEMKFKLENFEKGKLLNKNLYTNMKSDVQNGMDFDSIIKRSSELIMNQLSPLSNFKNKKCEKGLTKSSSVKIFTNKRFDKNSFES